MKKHIFRQLFLGLFLIIALMNISLAATKHNTSASQTASRHSTPKKSHTTKSSTLAASTKSKKQTTAAKTKSNVKSKKLIAKKSSGKHHVAIKSERSKHSKIATRTNKKKPVQQVAQHKPVTQATINTNNINHAAEPNYLLSSIEKSLVSFVRYSVSSLHYTAYKMGGTKIDESRGIYVVDCSSYVDHVMKNVYPNAFTSLTNWSGSEKPNSDDYFHYFEQLSNDSKHWNSVDDVDSLRPGDVIVFRYKYRWGKETGGHVMIVMDKPIQNGDAFLVRIADSAPTGHSKDTRQSRGSGIGIGTMMLKVNPRTSRPYAYAWNENSRFNSNVSVAMARPSGVG
jgi:cell wall-associated NlpC family hydrolase